MYQIKITKTEQKDPEKFKEEVQAYEEMNRNNRVWNGDRTYPIPFIESNVLLCELTDEQFKKVKEQVLTVF